MNDTVIRVDDLTFRYPAPRATDRHSLPPTLAGLSFSVDAGEIYGFLGPSGAGKSTTQKILYCLLGGYTGFVRVAGREIREWSTELYSRIGIGFETPNLYTRLTGRENLEFALALRGADHKRPFPGDTPPVDSTIEEAVHRLGLEEAIDTRVETWSKGMRMRLAFIRAIAHRPPLLFLDEPTSGLDPFWARRIKDWILEIRAQGTAVFLTTHAMELADELCDRVGFLVEGSLVVQDAPAELKRRYGRSGVTIQGLDHAGKPRTLDLEYDALRTQPVPGFASITRVVNREVTLEQVFLTVTGRRLGGVAS